MIYLVHMDAKVCPTRPAQHYLGFTGRASLDERMAEHRAGTGARILAAAAERGVGFTVARTWPGSRSDERRLKNQHNAPKRLCPTCREQK